MLESSAQAIAEALPGSAVNVYAAASLTNGDAWTVLATQGMARCPKPPYPPGTGTLEILSREPKPLLFEGKTLVREEYAHVNVRRTLLSLSYLPLVQDEFADRSDRNPQLRK